MVLKVQVRPNGLCSLSVIKLRAMKKGKNISPYSQRQQYVNRRGGLHALPEFQHVVTPSGRASRPICKFCRETTPDIDNEIKRNVNLMQLGNFIDTFLARHFSGTYAHHKEHYMLSCSLWFSAPSF